MTELSLPKKEADCLRQAYADASVILEYGSGGSTRVGAEMAGKYVMSVESDRDWAIGLQYELDRANLPSPALVYSVDIGETGSWGRPKDASGWQRFHRYPLAIWDEPFFRPPDVVLIDGRFRPACFATVCLKTPKPVTVLFDDYDNRPRYHIVEQLAKPVEKVGRMARFELKPETLPKQDLAMVISLYFDTSFAADHVDYDQVLNPAKM